METSALNLETGWSMFIDQLHNSGRVIQAEEYHSLEKVFWSGIALAYTVALSQIAHQKTADLIPLLVQLNEQAFQRLENK